MLDLFTVNVKALTLNAGQEVEITAGIYSCTLILSVRPEKRIPASNNWGTNLYIEIYQSDNVLRGSFTTTTDDSGTATINLCANNIFLIGGSYKLRIKGQSHLVKVYNGINGFNNILTVVDLSAQPRLLAGETSNIFDNYINVLDLSTQIRAIYTNDVKNDLNQDGIVNSLDISNTIYNYLESGE